MSPVICPAGRLDSRIGSTGGGGGGCGGVAERDTARANRGSAAMAYNDQGGYIGRSQASIAPSNHVSIVVECVH